MRWLFLTLLMMLLTPTAHAFVSEALVPAPHDGQRDIVASFNAPFEPLVEADGVGSVTLVRESLTGAQRLRVESCAALMDVYYDGTWEVEAQETVYYTPWLIARCVALDQLASAGAAALTTQISALELDPDDLPAHLAPFENCQDRIDHIRAALAGETLADRLGDGWEEAVDDEAHEDDARLMKLKTAQGRTLKVELLGSYGTETPVWLVLVTQSDDMVGSTVMEVWPLTKAADDDGVTYVQGLDLVQAAMTTCPSFLPLLLTDECP